MYAALRVCEHSLLFNLHVNDMMILTTLFAFPTVLGLLLEDGIVETFLVEPIATRSTLSHQLRSLIWLSTLAVKCWYFACLENSTWVR